MSDLPATVYAVRRRGSDAEWSIVAGPEVQGYLEASAAWEVEELQRVQPAGLPDTHSVQWDVLAFHEAHDLVVGTGDPVLRDEDLRAKLILEEAKETAEAMTGRRVEVGLANLDGVGGQWIADDRPTRERDLADAIDGLCDLLCVIYGAAVSWGINLAPFWSEVHRANMDKQGGPKTPEGKQLKPDGWRPPDIAGVLERTYGVVDA